MSVQNTASEDKVALFDSVTGFAFGPVFESAEDADAFVLWLAEEHSFDPRELSDKKLEELHSEWYQEFYSE